VHFKAARLLLLRLPQNSLKQNVVNNMALGNHLMVLDKVNGVLSSDFLGVKGSKAKEGFTGHVDPQPEQVVILVKIPEVLLLLSDAGDGFHQAVGEQVGEGPDYLVDLGIEK
jgi:hypothetical protein